MFAHCRFIDQAFRFRQRRSLRVLSCVVGIAVWKPSDFCLIEFHNDVLTGPHQAFGAGDQFDGVSFVVEMHMRVKGP